MAKKAAYYQLAKIAYIQEGRSLGEIALLLEEQVAERTLQRWCAEGDWPKKREAWLRSDTTYQQKREQLKAALLDRAMETMDPQIVYAWAKAEAATRPNAAERMKELEAQEAVVKESGGGLSPAAVEEIRKKVLGL